MSSAALAGAWARKFMRSSVAAAPEKEPEAASVRFVEPMVSSCSFMPEKNAGLSVVSVSHVR